MPPRRPRVPRSAERAHPKPDTPETSSTAEAPELPAETVQDTDDAAKNHSQTPVASHVTDRLSRVASGASKRASEAWNSTAEKVAAKRTQERKQVLNRARAAATARPRPTGHKNSRDSGPRVVKPARSFSGHAVVLVLVLFISAIVVAPTLRVFLTQQAEISEIRADLELQSEQQRELTRQLERWEDSAYVQQQARERFNMVMPGEKKYMVVGGQTEAEQNEDIVEVTAEPEEPAWAYDLWESLIVSAHR
ncbi:FtsB family cell division protein [Citricoccus muralis]|uniref:Septum formation initiator family protein n=1 Tax=Citricoccus muralis TaxID=169134 RepID=A0ABY8H881_9MICC|nr:septum formation initiator family protein [Citricoccus muralis]WFP17359.1 septum formation initiator family protein [Citricoccus muralis]